MPRKIAAGEILSRGHGAGAADPHAWQSVPNAENYVGNIRDAMVAADPANATTYRANAAVYLTKLEALDHDVREAVARIPSVRSSQEKLAGWPASFFNIDDHPQTWTGPTRQP